jgi:hypothetical protein
MMVIRAETKQWDVGVGVAAYSSGCLLRTISLDVSRPQQDLHRPIVRRSVDLEKASRAHVGIIGDHIDTC